VRRLWLYLALTLLALVLLVALGWWVPLVVLVVLLAIDTARNGRNPPPRGPGGSAWMRVGN
jgi:hypothetical protein